MKKVILTQTGGPDVLSVIEAPIPTPQANEVVIKHHAIGLNYIDTYHRSGVYPLALPSGLGLEAVGEIVELGADVDSNRWPVGQMVAYCGGKLGAYAQFHSMPVQHLFTVPSAIDPMAVASSLLKGLTVQYLFCQIRTLKQGDSALFYAAAGGVGLIACQWAKHLGVRLIGVVRGAEKVALARAHGCAEVIDSQVEDVVGRVRELTAGKGVDTVYDSVGKSTFLQSLDCLAPRGLMVSFGNTSGPVPAFSLSELANRGSLTVTRPTLATFLADHAQEMGQMYFELLQTKIITPVIAKHYALSEVAVAHRELEAGGIKGGAVLLPN